MKKIILPILFFFSINTFAQSSLHCGSQKVMKKHFEKHPEIKAKLNQHEFSKKNIQANRAASISYTIPVVFHILHQNGPENIANSQVIDAMQILNRDFAKKNSDTSSIIASFKTIADSTDIHFALAQIDPNGSCTNGIIHYFDADADWSGNSPTVYSQTWDPTMYLNIYVVRTIDFDAAGFTYLPGSFWPGDPWDAIVILHNFVGSIGTGAPVYSRVLTHEVGHWLDLLHVFGDNEPATDCNNDDFVNDTPPTPGYTSCPDINTPSSYQQCSPGVNENFQNYMDYSYCNKMFTHDQGQRMRNALNDNIAGRDNLSTTNNLIATGVSVPAILCQADFKSSSLINIVCQDNSLTFTDLSWNGTPTSWNWSFPGGTPATSTNPAPVVQYTTPGTYNVGLTVSNGSGSVNITKTAYVTVNSSTAIYNDPIYSEGFEGAALPNIDWKVVNQLPGGNTWIQTSSAASTGSKSVMITNSTASDTYVDELIGPSIDMTAISGGNPILTFKVAHAQKTSSSLDKLQIYVSTNCGISWTLRKAIIGSALSTAGIQSSTFTPNSSQWVQQSVALSGYVNQTNLLYMFRFTSDGGNNIYLDDINISGTTGIDNELYDQMNFNIYPNPAEQNTIISFHIPDKQKAELKIYDITGREILSIYNGELKPGEHQYSIGKQSNLVAGVYLVTLSVDRKNYTKKLIVK